MCKGLNHKVAKCAYEHILVYVHNEITPLNHITMLMNHQAPS